VFENADDPEEGEMFLQPEVHIDAEDSPMHFGDSLGGVEAEHEEEEDEEEETDRKGFFPKMMEASQSLHEQEQDGDLDMRQIELQKLQVMRELLQVETKRLKVEKKRLKVERMRLQIELQSGRSSFAACDEKEDSKHPQF